MGLGSFRLAPITLVYVYIWYMHIPYMHSTLFVRDSTFPHVIHVERSSYMSKNIAKLAMFESQKEVVCTTQLWNPKKKERKAKS